MRRCPRIIAGALHYFRVHPDLWADRIRKAKLMGLNTIETYVAWNAHEPRRGEWTANGALDLGRFLDLVAAEGLHAIVRPGPYICAEWHNGGLPTWLTAGERALRSSDPAFLADALELPRTPARHAVRAAAALVRPMEALRARSRRLEDHLVSRGRSWWEESIRFSSGGRPLTFEPPARLRS